MNFAKFHIKVNGITAERVELNGVEHKDQVKALRFDGARGDIGRVIVEFMSDDIEVEGEGIVYVQKGGDDFIDFLKGVDTQTLESEVLRRQEWGSSSVQTTIDLLLEWFGGQSKT